MHCLFLPTKFHSEGTVQYFHLHAFSSQHLRTTWFTGSWNKLFWDSETLNYTCVNDALHLIKLQPDNHTKAKPYRFYFNIYRAALSTTLLHFSVVCHMYVTLHTEGLWFHTTGWRQWCHRFWSSRPPYREDNDSELKETMRQWMFLALSVLMHMFCVGVQCACNITWVYLAIDVR